MSKSWQIYALHILDVAAKIDRIQVRGDITKDEVLYDATPESPARAYRKCAKHACN